MTRDALKVPTPIPLPETREGASHQPGSGRRLVAGLKAGVCDNIHTPVNPQALVPSCPCALVPDSPIFTTKILKHEIAQG